MTLRILVDGRNLSLKTGTGVATYARNVCRVAANAGHRVDVLYGEPFGYHRNPVFREISFFDAAPGASSQTARLSRYLAASMSPVLAAKPFEVPLQGTVDNRQFASRLPHADGYWNAPNIFYNADMAYANRYRIARRFNRVSNPMDSDIAHWTYPLPLKLEGAGNIYTIHDLVPLRLPFTTLDRKRPYYRMIAQICREADAIVTVSEHSKRDIMELFAVSPDKIFNTYQSVEIPERLLEIDEASLARRLLGAHGLTYKDYILFYGAIEPKKNLGRLIEAYLASGLKIPLMVVGKDGWLYQNDPALKRIVGQSPVNQKEGKIRPGTQVRRLDYVSFNQLVDLIRGARMVALPSLYEGFGLPIIEAMMCGTPVLTSGAGATAEIAGDAALLVDPYDVSSIRDGLVALGEKEQLRQHYVEAGYRRIEDFSPSRHAERLAEVYSTVAEARRNRTGS